MAVTVKLEGRPYPINHGLHAAARVGKLGDETGGHFSKTEMQSIFEKVPPQQQQYEKFV